MTIPPLVTIGIPTFNRASTLGRALESALAQDYSTLEIVISDNASQDTTETLCRRYESRDRRVRYIRQPANVGPTENFNAILRIAHGEFFMWLGDDDWIDHGYVRACMDILELNQQVVLAAGRSRAYQSDGFQFWGVRIDLPQDDSRIRLLTYFSRVGDNSTFYGVFRRSVASGMTLQNVVGGDWLFVAALAFQGRIQTTLQATVHRATGDGASASPSRIARTLKVHWIQGLFPFTSIAFSAFVDIAWRDGSYKCLLPRDRLVLAGRAWVCIMIRKAILQNAKSLVVRFARFLLGTVRYRALREKIGRRAGGV